MQIFVIGERGPVAELWLIRGAVLVAIGKQGWQGPGEIVEWIEVEFAAGDHEAEERGDMLATVSGDVAQSVFAQHGVATEDAFGEVVVGWDGAVGEENGERFSMRQ